MSKLTFSVNGTNKNETRLDVEARQFSIVVDEPAQLNGTDAGANPVEYILAGYAGCLNVVAHIVAKELGFTIHKLSVEVSGDINPARFLGLSNDERAGFQGIKVKLDLDSDADQATIEKWIEVVENRCPVNDNLANPTPVSISLGQRVSLN
ncbi:OsmC family protein [Alkaliflexus imshenetskii]|uniref:OsmC family protein n=1 Tax=Alkaliflexus imshenetskii TaxID=286730 RepID=UPI00047E6664|nr:OsmC family protein [Alkaliflexus imshenetskii]